MTILRPEFARGRTYAAPRCAHSAIHLTSNEVLWRFRAFTASWPVLPACWIALGQALAPAGAAPAAAG